MQLPDIGNLFEGRYQIVDLLGEGGFARVFRAEDTKLQRVVALKVISPQGGEYTAKAAKRFLREAAVLASLQDPHTITLFDFGESADGLLYMAFEFVAGRDLSIVLEKGGPMDAHTCGRILDQVLSSLREAHNAGILHRDIKPANILVADYGGARLLDFGIAKARNQDHAQRLTETGRVVGTPRYMSPEQLFGEELTPASDIYSLGLVAFEMLLGRSPIEGSTHRQVMEQQLSPLPWRIPPQLAPEPMRAVLERMLAREAPDRYQSADEAMRALRDAARAATYSAPADPRDEMETLRKIAPVPAPHGELGVQTTEATGESNNQAGTNTRGAFLLAGLVAVAAALVAFIVTRDAPRPPVHAALRPPLPAPTRPPKVVVERADTQAEDTGSQGDATNPLAAGPQRSRGCSAPVPPIGELRRKEKPGVDIQGAIDESYDHSTPQALVVLLNAQWGVTNAEMLRESGLPATGAEQGFLPVAFRKTPTSWESTEADLAAVERGLQWVTDEVCIDLSNIFIVGDGTGGAAATVLRCSDDFSPRAIATISYRARNPLRCPTDDERPIPMLMLAGRNNKMTPIAGGKSCLPFVASVPSLAEHIELWRELQRCSGETREVALIDGADCETWTCHGPLISCVHDGGRSWPGTEDDGVIPGCSGGPPPFDPGAEVWKFFASHRIVYDDAQKTISPGK